MVAAVMTNGREGENRKEMVSAREDEENTLERWEAITVRLRRVRVVTDESAEDCAMTARRCM